jgi:hypothetical protein
LGMAPRSPVRPVKAKGNKGVFQNSAPARLIARQYVALRTENSNRDRARRKLDAPAPLSRHIKEKPPGCLLSARRRVAHVSLTTSFDKLQREAPLTAKPAGLISCRSVVTAPADVLIHTPYILHLAHVECTRQICRPLFADSRPKNRQCVGGTLPERDFRPPECFGCELKDNPSNIPQSDC